MSTQERHNLVARVSEEDVTLSHYGQERRRSFRKLKKGAYASVEFNYEMIGRRAGAKGEHNDTINTELLDRLEALRAQVLTQLEISVKLLRDGEINKPARTQVATK